MDLTGRIKDVDIDFKTRKPMLRLLINENVDGIEKLLCKELSISIKRLTKRRSLDSNAYFHVLCDKLRQANNVSMAAQKNELITAYGQIEYMDGEPLFFKTNAPPEVIREQESVHMGFVKRSYDGAYWYRLYRGSHTYNVDEMRKLIEGTVLDCKQYGIETATPDQLLEMQKLWERNRGKKNE